MPRDQRRPLGFERVVDLLQRSEAAGGSVGRFLPIVVIAEMAAPPHAVGVTDLAEAPVVFASQMGFPSASSRKQSTASPY